MIYHLLVWIGNSAVLLNILYLLFLRRKLVTPLYVLLVLLIGVLGIQIALAVLASYGEYNQYLSHYYVVGQFLLLSLFYFFVIKRFRKVVFFCVIVFIVFLLYQINSMSFNYEVFNTPIYLVSSCMLLTYTMAYFIEYIKEKYLLDLMNIGLFLYFGGSSIIFFTMNHWKDFGEWNDTIWMLNAIMFILFQFSIAGSIRAFQKSLNN